MVVQGHGTHQKKGYDERNFYKKLIFTSILVNIGTKRKGSLDPSTAAAYSYFYFFLVVGLQQKKILDVDIVSLT